MSATSPSPKAGEKKGSMLDIIEKLGNKVPHPVLMFLYLIIFVIVLSQLLAWANISVTDQIAVTVPVMVDPEYYEDTTQPGLNADMEVDYPEFVIEERTIAIRSLLSTEGIRFLFTSFVSNFQGFGVVAVTFVAMMGAGVAEAAGMFSALIRKLVKVAPQKWITFIIVFVGVLTSIASDAGYLILIPLGAAAFLSLRRHPLAGMAAAYAGVSAVFAVNIIFTPIDSMLTEITNEAIGLTSGAPITIAANYFFMVASSIFIALVATVVTDRIVEPRLGKYVPDADHAAAYESADQSELSPQESLGLKYAGIATLVFVVMILLLSVPNGAPLHKPEGYEGNSPLMDSLLFLITLLLLIAGIAFGKGAGTIKSSNEVIAAITKTFSGLAGLVFMLLMISQFIAYFNYTNMPTVTAIWMAELLERANIGALPLLIGFMLVIMLLDIIIPGVVPKWAIFAPVFIPIFTRLGTTPQTVLAAYRIGDSPMNVITPLMVYLPFIITVAQGYDKKSGLGTIIALMLPYTLVILVAWILFFIFWFVLGVPLGPGYPVSL
ncbi:MAG TPA: AbgT family transporter [Anaerolineales bacterium]|nr:AbgT family transporter [Anaerolineales bacterium]